MLVVDDEPGILRFVRASLSLEGYEVFTCTGGEEALRLVESERPDIMLLDIFMVPLTGFDVLSRLRTYSRLPVIVFTARSDIGEMAIKEGANGFIAKPFKPVDLVRKIREILDSPDVP